MRHIERVMYAELPESIHAFVKLMNEDEKEPKYIIVVNSLADEEDQSQAIRHELAHIKLNHFFKDKPVTEIEAEAEEYCSKNSFRAS